MGTGWLVDAVGLERSITLPASGAPIDVPTFIVSGGPVRAILIVVLLSVLGLGVCWWNGGLLDRSIDAAAERPFASLGYGLATHGAIAFAGFYLTAKLGRVPLDGYFVGWLGVLIGVGMILVTAAVGFAVVGTVIVGAFRETTGPAGVIVGALMAGSISLLEPVVGVVTWLILVSAGIGGFARRWATDSVVRSG